MFLFPQGAVYPGKWLKGPWGKTGRILIMCNWHNVGRSSVLVPDHHFSYGSIPGSGPKIGQDIRSFLKIVLTWLFSIFQPSSLNKFCFLTWLVPLPAVHLGLLCSMNHFNNTLWVRPSRMLLQLQVVKKCAISWQKCLASIVSGSYHPLHCQWEKPYIIFSVISPSWWMRDTSEHFSDAFAFSLEHSL